jgi:AraC-like DNA-binding protein
MAQRFHLKRRYDSLRALGIAVEHFPHYTNRAVNLHSLDVVLLSFIVKGRGYHQIDDETFAVTGASLAVTHYGQQHSIVTNARGMDVINVYLDLEHHALPALPRELQAVLPLLLPLHPRFQHRLNRIVQLRFDDPRPLAALLFSIQRELSDRPAGYEEAVQLQWKLFLIHCCRHALRSGFVPPKAAPHRLEELRQHLDHAFADAHTLAALARRAKLSRTSLCRSFKTYTGKRVFDYLIERRIQAAMVALRGSDEKVLSIAMNTGFRDLAYFNRKFKQLVGVTPTAYRGG